MEEQFRSYFSPELVDEVINKCQELIVKQPHEPRHFRDLGHAHFKKGQYAEAIDAFRKAINLNHRDTPMHIAVGRCLHLLKNLDEAETSFKTALDQKPDWPDTHFWFGRIRFEQGHAKEALGFIDKALELNPRFRDALYTQALIKEELGELKEAITCLKNIIAIPGLPRRSRNPFPYDMEALFDDPVLLNESIRQLEGFAKRNPEYADVQYKLGMAYRRKGEKEKAMAAFRAALRINPDFHLARHYYWHWEDQAEDSAS